MFVVAVWHALYILIHLFGFWWTFTPVKQTKRGALPDPLENFSSMNTREAFHCHFILPTSQDWFFSYQLEKSIFEDILLQSNPFSSLKKMVHSKMTPSREIWMGSSAFHTTYCEVTDGPSTFCFWSIRKHQQIHGQGFFFFSTILKIMHHHAPDSCRNQWDIQYG